MFRVLIPLKMANQGRFDLYVAFTMIFCELEYLESSITLPVWTSMAFKSNLGTQKSHLNIGLNLNFITYRIQMLVPHRIMVKAT